MFHFSVCALNDLCYSKKAKSWFVGHYTSIYIYYVYMPIASHWVASYRHGASVMVWGEFSYYDGWPFDYVTMNMNLADYFTILGDPILSFILYFMISMLWIPILYKIITAVFTHLYVWMLALCSVLGAITNMKIYVPPSEMISCQVNDLKCTFHEVTFTLLSKSLEWPSFVNNAVPCHWQVVILVALD